MQEEIQEILQKLNLTGEELVCKKHGKRSALTSRNIVTRLIMGGSQLTKEEVFLEMSKDTATKLLRTVFGNVSPRGSNTWYLHALSLINKRHCDKCLKIVCLPTITCSECKKSYNRNYYQSHKAETLARKLKRQNAIAQATPSWANISAMNDFYKNCPEGMEVDHWAPIQGELVCGLHTLANLQYLTVSDNRAKSNKFVIE